MSKPHKADARIVPTYLSAYNEIVKPKDYVSLSVYFIKHWLPKISENGLKVLVVLRTQGFYNPTTGEKREEIEIEQKHIAEQCGFSKRTLQRTFVEDPVLAKYVQREFVEKRDRTGRIVKEYYVYRVVMDDVMIPEDKALFDVMLEGRDKPRCQNDASGGEPMRQNDAPERQGGLQRCQNDAPERQIGTSYKVNLTTPTTENTETTPAAPGDSLSLFEGEQKGSATVMGALQPAEPPTRPTTLKEVEAEWRVMSGDVKERFRAEAVRQLSERGQASPPNKMIEPLMFKLFWVERKGLSPSKEPGK